MPPSSERSGPAARTRGVVLAGLLLILGAPEPAPGQGVPADYVEHFFGAVHLGVEEMPLADRFGATWSRHGIQWGSHEPRPGEIDLTDADSLFRSARSHGVRVLPVLSYVPGWASTAPEGHPNAKHFPPRENRIDAWRDYVRTVVERYPDVEYFEIWNEPNIDWFLATERNHRVYVDRILAPAAEVIHARGRKVVAPSYTLEWPLDDWPPAERPARVQRNLSAAIRDVDRWLSYQEAWRHVDVLSVHYSKGDVRPTGVPSGDNLMPFYEHVYREWIAPGKLEGIWNTEEGLTAVEAGTAGFVAMEPWERPPYARWVPRYTLPVLHWALRRDWRQRDQYRVFWYHAAAKRGPGGTLSPTNLIQRHEGGFRPSPVGRALGTLASLFPDSGRVGVFSGHVEIGFGLLARDPSAPNNFPPYRMTTYAFRLEPARRPPAVLVAVWLDLPGIEEARPEQPGIEARLRGIFPEREISVETVDYLTGETRPVDSVRRTGEGTLEVRIPRTSDPVLYLRIRAARRDE